MKVFIAIIGCLVLLINKSYSQDNETDFRTKFSFGVKGGINKSNVYDTEGEIFRADAKYGMMGGVFFAIPFGTYLGIQPEVLLSQKGFKATGRLLGSDYEISRTTNFIAVPLLVAFKPSEFFTIVLGPQYSYLYSQKDVLKAGNNTVEHTQVFANDNIRKNILSAVVGLDITMKHFVLGGRAGWDLQRNIGSSNSTTPRYKNAWLQASIGYRFYTKD
jgi:hypothetical protein